MLSDTMLVFCDQELKNDITYCVFNTESQTYDIRYKNGSQIYSYNPIRIECVKNPVPVPLGKYNYRLKKTQKALENIKSILLFDSRYYKFTFENYSKVYHKDELIIDIDLFKYKKTTDLLTYYRGVAENMSDKESYLLKQLENMTSINADCVLASFKY